MDEVNYSEFREMLKRELPRVIREHPETRYEVFELLMEVSSPRPDLTAQFEAFRREWAERDRRDDAFQAKTEQRFDRLEGEVYEFRKEVGQRFEQIDEHLEQVDQRFEQVDQRFEQVDQRFEQVDQRFEQVDQRFEQVDQRFEQVDQRFEQVIQQINDVSNDLHRAIDRLGARWGIRNESIFRQTIETVLVETYGSKVETLTLEGEQFDVVISNGDHILIEIAASTSKNMLDRLIRKRNLYEKKRGITPARVILATGSIHYKRAQSLRDAGFEVIVPEDVPEDD